MLVIAKMVSDDKFVADLRPEMDLNNPWDQGERVFLQCQSTFWLLWTQGTFIDKLVSIVSIGEIC